MEFEKVVFRGGESMKKMAKYDICVFLYAKHLICMFLYQFVGLGEIIYARAYNTNWCAGKT